MVLIQALADLSDSSSSDEQGDDDDGKSYMTVAELNEGWC